MFNLLNVQIFMHEFCLQEGGITAELLVDAETPNEPAFLTRRGTHGDTFMDFHEFKSGTPEAAVFNVPAECQWPVSASSVCPTTLMAFVRFL